MYLKRHTLWLEDVFESFRKLCLEIYELDPGKFFSDAGLAWQADFKKTKVKIELLTDIGTLLIVEKGIRGRLCHFINGYEKANIKYTKDYDKNKESSHIKYWNVNNFYR